MNKPQHVLVVVDPTTEEQPAVARGAWLAKRFGAGLELFICDYDQYLASDKRAQESLIKNHNKRLKRLAKPLSDDGVRVSVDACWDRPLDDGIVRKVLRSGADILVKDTHYHSALRKTLFTNTDWALIRDCPVPLLLVKPKALSAEINVLAAVDPLHERDKPAELDHRILSFALALGEATNADLHVAHAYDAAPETLAAVSVEPAAAPPAVAATQALIDAVRKRHREALDKLLGSFDIKKDNIHFRSGRPQDLLPQIAEEMQADFAVLGAVARGAVKRLFLGSTAEGVLDQMPCDLVVVKSADFKTPVSKDK